MKSEDMKTIGLIGGMSFESTLTYYQIINETIRKELGGLHRYLPDRCGPDQIGRFILQKQAKGPHKGLLK